MATYPVIEHRSSRSARWIRAHRLQIAFIVALVETVLVVANVLQWRWALVIAGGVFAFHFFLGRKLRSEPVRQLSWAAVVSQTLPVLVPFVAVVVSGILVMAVIGAAVVVLALLVVGRR